ncbi:MAG: amidinotransferase [Planctomycetota bacterium]|nr:amidinotransferase [Planctomycetota bacterium]
MSGDGSKLGTPAKQCPVNSHNEWDPLEEVIVGRLEHAMLPDSQIINKHTFPPSDSSLIQAILELGGVPYPPEMLQAAQKCLDQFIHLLEAEGVVVRRPDIVDYEVPFRTPDWKVPSGSSATNPRDPFLVVGHEIIEAPMADRSRLFEASAYRSLFKEYFRQGAKWVAAPRPQLLDALYHSDFVPSKYGDDEIRFVVTEFEPTFDAADFVRCGRDLIGQMSHVTNECGIEWLRRHLGEDYEVHVIKSRSPQAMHIDTTLMPLAPGKVLVNPDWVDLANLPACLQNWDILIAPRPVPSEKMELRLISSWASMNVLMLDERRVIVEQRQEPMISALREWGFEPIPCPFEDYYPFLGSFHCATLDVRRRGELKSYA